MGKIIFVAQIVVSVAIVIAILMQNRGSGLSAVFGGGSSGAYRTKRGLEKGLYVTTIVLVILFVAIGILNLVIAS